jgi:hypothetical protein
MDPRSSPSTVTMTGVRAAAGLLAHDVVQGVDEVHIVAGVARQPVVPGAAVKDVVAVVADQDVVVAAADSVLDVVVVWSALCPAKIATLLVWPLTLEKCPARRSRIVPAVEPEKSSVSLPPVS